MDDYISREKAKEMLNGDYAYAAAKMLDRVPAADVAPVVHGRWVMNEVVYRSPAVLNYHCSACGRSAHTARFCPNCGAKMDL